MYFLKVYRITDTFELIVKNLSDLTRPHRTATFADSETQTNVQSYSVDQVYSDLYVITRHHHFNTFGKSDFTGAVHSAEIELGTILITERSMTTTLLFLQYIDRSLELLVRLNLTRMAKHHTALNLILIDTAEEQTYVIASLTFVKNLTEHLNTGNNRLLVFTKTEELNFIAYLNTTSLNTTGSNSTTTSDREHILNRHQERLVDFTLRLLNPVVNRIHQLNNFLHPLINAIQSTKGRTTDDRSIFFKVVLFEDFTNFHFNEFEHFFILNHIALVQEYHQARNIHLTSEQNVLTCLRHRTIGSSYNENSTIHLSSTSNHVLHIVSVSRAVYVGVVTVGSFIFNVSGVDGNTTLFLLRSVVDLIERLDFLITITLLRENLRNGSSQSCLTVVYVTNSTNVNMRLGTLECLFSHSFTLFIYINEFLIKSCFSYQSILTKPDDGRAVTES